MSSTKNDDLVCPSADEANTLAVSPANSHAGSGGGGEDDRRCRFCLYGENEVCEDDGEIMTEKLIAPCKCTGSAKWIHESCLRKWQQTVQITGGNYPDAQ